MKKAICWILAFALTMACFAQSAMMPTIIGHQLGETIAEFVAASTHETQDRIADCRKVSEYNKHANSYRSLPFAGCASLLDIEQDVLHNGSFTCSPQSDYMCADFLGTAQFKHNKLVGLYFTVRGEGWDELLASAKAKLGKPDYIDGINTRKAHWQTSNYSFEIDSSGGARFEVPETSTQHDKVHPLD